MKTTKEMIAVMQAFADGKEIEYSFINGSWYNDKNPCWNWVDYNYRVKHTPEYVPFIFEDAEFLIGKLVKSKNKNWVEIIIWCSNTNTSVTNYATLLSNYTFIDGSPCGKLK